MTTIPPRTGPLSDLKVIDASNVIAGPIATQFLADFGADVIKLERPGLGDSIRRNDFFKDGQPLRWKLLGRNKRSVGLYLGDPRGAELVLKMIEKADVFVENYRPGTIERWGLGPEVLLKRNPRLIILRISGFGQKGPYAKRRAFGTLLECMSGFAHLNGTPDGPPMLPPFGMADFIAGTTAAAAIGVALHERERSGKGQVIDATLLRPILAALGPIIVWYDQLGFSMRRTGNRTLQTGPRGIYATKDDRWVGIGISTDETAAALMEMVGHGEVVKEPWFKGGANRVKHDDELDTYVKDWVRAHTAEEVVRMADAQSVPAALVYEAPDIVDDPQVKAAGVLTEVEDPDLGPIKMQNVSVELSRTPGSVRFPGRAVAADSDDVLRKEMGLPVEYLTELAAAGVIQWGDVKVTAPASAAAE